MNIAVLAWGSLIWCPGSLRVRTLWRSDGPRLPIEFARISQDRRLTLVIHPGAPEQSTYWALSEFTMLNEARDNLKRREGSKSSDIHRVLRDGTVAGGVSPETSRVMTDWVRQHRDVDAVIWTGLPGNWQEKRGGSFTPEDATSFLAELEAERDRAKASYDRAREYLTNTPSAVDTPVRKLMRARGWHDVQLSAALFESKVTAELPTPDPPTSKDAADSDPERT